MKPKRRHIAHVVRQYHPSVGGMETYVIEVASRQASTQRVVIITLNRAWGSPRRLPNLERSGRVVIIRIPFLGFREFFLPLFNASLLGRFDIVHVHATDQFLDMISLASRWRSICFFVTTHGLFFHTKRFARIKRIYLKAVTRHSLARSRAIFAVSKNDQRTLAEVGVRSKLLRNPIVPIGDFIASGRDLIYIGRFAENKRIDKLLEFLAAVRHHDPQITLQLVGSDPHKLWDRLRGGTANSGGAQGCAIYHGYLPQLELQTLLQRCGFVVSASSYEGFGMSMVEGMSVGLLPVMHNNDAFRELKELSGAGLICDFDNPTEAAGRFVAWRKTVRPEDREAAREYARAQCWEDAVSVIERLYDENCGPDAQS